ncbi:helix-turn-helix domain-containing protein [Streptococcus mitis]|uniref:helix-turn-helix domain-containing protein n=1 Tax=Streptococcus mitis TaxID=28037 RepID=UPI0039C06F11
MDEKKRMQIIAENITHFRKQRGITQKELAKEVGITASTMTDYMKLRSAPSFGVIQKLSDYFGVKKSDIDTTFKEESTNSLPDIPDLLTQQITDKVVQLTPDNKKIVLRTSEELLESQKANGEMYTEQNEEETKINEVSENIIRLDDYRQTTYRRVTGVVSAGSGSMQDDDLDMEVSFYEDEIPDDYDAIAYVVGNSMEPKIKNGDYLFIKNTPQVDFNTIGIFQVDGANYVKKLRQGYLESLNPDYEDIHLDESNDIRTIGEVVSVYREK